MSCLVFDLILFKGSYFVKECYYTLAVVDLQLFMTSSEGQNLWLLKMGRVRYQIIWNDCLGRWICEKIIGDRLSLPCAEICLKIMELFLESFSGCSVFHINLPVIIFSGRKILKREQPKIKISRISCIIYFLYSYPEFFILLNLFFDLENFVFV